MISIYKFLTNAFYPFFILFTFLRKLKKKEDSFRYKEKIFTSSFNIIRNKNTKLIWFHAASVGEMNSIVPIINELNKKNNNFEFLITTVTLSSGNLIKSKFSNLHNIHHRYFPLDVNFLTREFINKWKPNVVFFVDSEVWPNLIINLHESGIPISIINARITKKTFERWIMFKKTAKLIFSKFKLFLASNKETINYLRELGAKNIVYNGNIKLLSEIEINKIDNINKEFLKKKKFWLAASTHNGEEDFCVKTHLLLKAEFGKLITLIAPRHINRANNIKSLCESYNLNTQILDKNDLIKDKSEIIIINSFGVLNEFYKYALSVFIGKSTLKAMQRVGGQNPIDAAKLGCKIYHGPFIYNFSEIYEILNNFKISKQVNSPKELSNYLKQDLSQEKIIKSDIVSQINNLSNETLKITMSNINKFILNETL
tara:strand:+ start:2658 stop:3941 length:1284 start_codon:yes stop_codon:yes gene_type:complete